MIRRLSSIVVLAFTLGVCCCVSPSAMALPEGRHYEMVSPVYKGGYGLVALKAMASEPGRETADGGAFTSQGSFGGVPSNKYEFSYLARRGPTGWSTVPLEAPSSLSPNGGTTDLSPDLRYSIFEGQLGPSTGITQKFGSEAGVFRRETSTEDIAGNWGTVEVLKRVRGSEPTEIAPYETSRDQCHFVVYPINPNVSFLPQPEKAHERLYDIQRGGGECGSEGYLRFIGLNNQGKFINAVCGVHFGADGLSNDARGSDFNAISADGKEIFFTDPKQGECNGGAGLYLRLAGSRTIEVSKPAALECVEVPCPGASERAPAFFEGASEDGTKVFFTTTQALVGSDEDSGNDLYLATIGCPAGREGCAVEERQVTSLAQVSHAAGEAALVQHAMRVAPDGSRAYFVARGVLSSSANALGQAAVRGADNLYVYDVASNSTAFVAELCSGPGSSGEADDSRCPQSLDSNVEGINDTSLWESGNFPEAQSTRDGRFLVFSTYAQLVKGDTDGSKDVYRYDAVTGEIDRASLGEAGADGNGNGGEGAVDDASIKGAFVSGRKSFEQREAGTRAVSEDGSRIVFSSAEALSEAAINGDVNVYEWRKAGSGEGVVSLVSSGDAPTSDCCAAISPSGSDIFFGTNAALVRQDTDEARDLYDARTGPAFPVVPVPPEECGESCQGPLSTPIPLLVPASSAQAPGENIPPPHPAAKPKPKKHKAAKRGRRKAKRASGGRRRVRGAKAGRGRR
jgi:hypothetical protein